MTLKPPRRPPYLVDLGAGEVIAFAQAMGLPPATSPGGGSVTLINGTAPDDSGFLAWAASVAPDGALAGSVVVTLAPPGAPLRHWTLLDPVVFEVDVPPASHAGPIAVRTIGLTYASATVA